MSKQDKVATTNPNTAVGMPFDYSAYQGQGLNISLDDLKIPFLQLVQKDSKCLDSDEEKFVPGGKNGDILNTASKVYTDGEKGLLLVPACIKSSMVEYLPDRGGFVGEHEMTSQVAIAGQANGNVNPESGNDLVKTKTMFAIVVDEATMEPIDYAVVPFTSSKLGPWSEYWTKINTAKFTKDLPEFLHLLRLTVKDQKNAKGKFKNYSMFPARNEAGELTMNAAESSVPHSMLDPNGPLVKAGEELKKAVLSGRAQADNSTREGGEAKSSDGHF